MNRYIAFLDILGFKDMVENTELETLKEQFNNFRIYVQKSLADDNTVRDQWGRAVFDLSESTVNSTMMSDSLLFWTNGSSTSELFELIECLHSLMSFCHNLPHIFLRGCLTYGEFYYDDSGRIPGINVSSVHTLMVGKGLVNAVEAEKRINLASCIITEEALTNASHSAPDEFNVKIKACFNDFKIVRYATPMKTGIEDYVQINWVRDIAHPTREELQKGFTSFNKKLEHPEAIIKMENTLQFYDYIKSTQYGTKPE